MAAFLSRRGIWSPDQGEDGDPNIKIKGPPSNEQWDESRENDLPTVRMAFACLLMPKDKLTEFAGEMMAEDEHSFEEVTAQVG